MNSVFGLVLVAGVGLAGTAVYMVQGHFETTNARLAATQAAVAAATPTVEVWAVNRQVVYGERLTRDDVAAVQYAQPFLPEGAFLTQAPAEPPAEGEPPWAPLFPEGVEEVRVVLRQMEPNEPVLAVKVTEPGEDAGLTSRLSEGMRAFAISVDVSSGVSGFLRPGDRADVYWSGSVAEGGADREVTQLIEAGLRIVAIDQTADDNLAGATVAGTVTVEVSPQQVANLAQAQATGSLSLSLVGQGDATLASAIEVDQRSLLGLEDAPLEVAEAAAAAPVVCTVRTRRGADVVETPVPCPTD